VAFRKKIYQAIDELQTHLDVGSSNTTSDGPTKAAGALAKPRCTPFLDALPLAKEKILLA